MLQLLKKIKTPKNNEIRSEINSLNYIHQIAHTVHYIYVNYAHKHTLASSSSVSVLTPNRGMFEFVRLDECCSFFTPLIWDMGLFFFSFSFCVWGDGISTSCCLSGETQCRKKRTEKWIQRLSRCRKEAESIYPCHHSPRKVLEMNSETWFPERLISERCVSSLFNILLNWKRSTHVYE